MARGLLTLVDSGVEHNLLDPDVASQLCLPLEPLPSPIIFSALNGGIFTTITHKTKPITLIVFWKSVQINRVLWLDRRIEDWSLFYLSNCLQLVLQSSSHSLSEMTTPLVDLSLVPTEYHDLGTVFSKDRALSLPPSL